MTGRPQLLSPWTRGTIEQLKELWAMGLSATQIAVAIGGNISRNAVIGKVRRLKLPYRGPTINVNREKSRTARSKPYIRRTHSPQHFVRETGPGPIEAPPDPAEVLGPPIPFMQLKENSCRWPLTGEDDVHYFCGAPKVEGISYCAFHHNKSVSKPLTISEQERLRRHYHALKNINLRKVNDWHQQKKAAA